jgi:hypothetical protein
LVFIFSSCIPDFINFTYSLVGTWKGSLQDDTITLTFESNNKGKIIFESSNNEYQLSSSFNKENNTFVADYGYDSYFGWQQRTIKGSFSEENVIYIEAYNQIDDKIASGTFIKQ